MVFDVLMVVDFLGMVTLEGLNLGVGTLKSGHFRGGGHFRGVVTLEGLHFVINQ